MVYVLLFMEGYISRIVDLLGIVIVMIGFGGIGGVGVVVVCFCYKVYNLCMIVCDYVLYFL